MALDIDLLQIRLLGPLQVRRRGHPVDIGPRKQRAVFVYLALHANAPVSVSRILGSVWGDSLPATAAGLVHTYIARLRRALEPETPRLRRGNVISSTPDGYRLNVKPAQVDLLRFRSLARDARLLQATGDRRRAFDTLGEAMRLWRCDTRLELAELPGPPAEVYELHGEWVANGLDYITAGLEQGEAAAVLPLAERLASAEPLHETVQARYLVALARTGQRAAAVDRYADLRAQLRGGLGVEPSPELVAAYRTVIGERRTSRPAQARPAVPAVEDPEGGPWRGPGPPANHLVGRSEETARLRAFSVHERLVTLTGPAGVGKTMQALALAERVREGLIGGVTVVDMSDIRDPRGMWRRLFHTMRPAAQPYVEGYESLVEALHRRQMLLVLDNVDQVVDDVARAVDAVVRHCPHLTLLVTSREHLGLPYEATWQVPPLAVPDHRVPDSDRLQQIPAVELFVRRAAQVLPGFRLDPATAPVVAAICRRLDGLPLALELAATRLRSCNVHRIYGDLANGLSQLRLWRWVGPAHHRSLDDALRWTYDNLASTDRRCLSILARLDGSFRLDKAADASSWMPVDDLHGLVDRLVDRSWLQRGDDIAGTSYRMLWVIRQFCTAASPGQCVPLPAGSYR